MKPSELTVHDVKVKKRMMESLIDEAVNNFEKTTGMEILKIDLLRGTNASYPNDLKSQVTIDTKI